MPPTNKDTTHPSGDNRFKLLDRAITKHQSRGDALIEVLHAAQGIFGFLDNDLLIYVARSLKLPLSRVYGVATFYHFFTLKPKGNHTFVLCTGTACYVKGAAGNALPPVRSGRDFVPFLTDSAHSYLDEQAIGVHSL